jgi:hypothetical protein
VGQDCRDDEERATKTAKLVSSISVVVSSEAHLSLLHTARQSVGLMRDNSPQKRCVAIAVGPRARVALVCLGLP